MSAGARIPLEKALRVADALFDRWRLDRSACFLVGSCRRGRPDVGDIEVLAPAEPKNRDSLVGRISATMDGEGVFAAANPDAIGRVVQGLKPGFLTASLVIRPFVGDAQVEIPCQVCRYAPDNLGWSMIRTTGPGDYGRWFLGRWKRHHGIPPERQASIDNNLVDAGGNLIATPTEEQAFALCGLPFLPPERRDDFIARAQAMAAGGRA